MGKRAYRTAALLGATAGIFAAAPAWAQCATTTADDVTTLDCVGDTVTTDDFNNNGNSPSTTASLQTFSNRIDATIGAGATVRGYGLYVRGTGGNPVTVTNNGTVSNTSGATDTSVLVHGLVVEGNGGLVTYRGNGSAATNATPPAASPAYGVIMTNANGGGIDIGSAAAPVTGVFSGQGGFNVRAETGGPINAWFHGGTFTSTQASAGALRLFTRDNINLVMTGGSVLTGELRVQVLPNAPATAAATITTDARITQTLGPAMTVAGGRGGTDVTIAAGAAITGQASGLSMFQDGGVMRLTTAAGSTIRGNDAIGIGVQLQPDAGSVIADIAGDVSGSGGLFLVPADGNVDVTIREGATVTGTDVGVTVQRLPGGTGVVDILNLGTISSANTAADFDGTLRIGNGGTAGTISGDIANRGTLIFNRSDALTYGGRISGTGALTKQGAGTLTLTGASTYSGATHVAAGTLLVNGSLASAVTVAGGATLGGAGSVGTSTVNGTLSPGGDGTIGTLTVNGNLVFGAGSSFRVDVGNGSNDRVNVTGTASLAGSLTAIAINGGFTSGTFTLLNAAGGISGTFNPLTSQPDAPVSLRYDANNVYLDIASGGSTTFSISQTQSLVFNPATTTTTNVTNYSTQIIGRLLGGAPLYDQTFAVAFADPAAQAGVVAARAAITTAGGPGVIIGAPVLTASSTNTSSSSTTTYSLAGTQTTDTTVITFGAETIATGQLSTCNVGGLPGTTRPTCQDLPGTPNNVAVGDINFNTITNTEYTIDQTTETTNTTTISEQYTLTGQVVAVGTIHAEVQSGLFDLGGRLLGRLGRIEAGNAGWGEFYGFRVNQRGRRDAWGFAGGVGVAVAPGVTLAAGVDHGRLDIDVPGALETGEVTLTQLGAVLRFDSGPFSASLAAVHGFGDAGTRRTIIGVSDADYDVRLTGVALDAGYAVETGGWTLRPGVGLDYVRLTTDAFVETDALGLAAAKEKADRARASAGVEIGRDFGGFSLAAHARYLAVLDGRERSLPVAFAIAPGRILEMSGAREPDGALLGARLAIPLAPRARLSFGYDGRFGNGYTAHAGSIGLNIAL